ncbi:MAG: hypothetical protein IJY94_06605 [Clostridia bacterium]|nr:hypothetical protein [Clostridia bacterium]
MICTFFGHRDAPTEICDKLQAVLVDLIENHGADTFYVGNNGNFDAMVRNTLAKLKPVYPHIEFTVVLAYLPTKKECEADYETIYPEGLEDTPPKFAISKRNEWLVENSDTVITYVNRSWGGAWQSQKLAEKRGKTVINLIQ